MAGAPSPRLPRSGETLNSPDPTQLGFLAQTAQWGALSFLLWFLYAFLLGPLWGWHLYGMGEWIAERAKFLQEHGQLPHPILEHYQALTLSEVWLGGSLYGALFFAWPMAIYMALGEVLVGPGRGWTMGFRALWGVGLFWGLGENIAAFADAGIEKVLAFGVVLVCPYVLNINIRNILNIRNNINIKINIIKKILPFALSFLILLPLLIHPVWSIWLTPERIDPKIKIKPLIRDMLLLNAQGESWINSWYYHSAPLLNEKERITVFQPMVVGLLGLEEAAWSERLRFGFQNPLHPQGQRMVFIKVARQDDIILWLDRGLMDYIAIEASLEQALNFTADQVPKGRIGFYSSQKWDKADGFIYLDPNHFVRMNPKELVQETPLTRQRELLRQQGYAPIQSACLMNAAQRMGKIFNQPWTLMSIVVLMVWGLISMVAIAVLKLCQSFSWLALSILLLTSPNLSWYREAFNYWRDPQNNSNYWSEVVDLHLKALRLSPNDLKSVLAVPLSQDQRLAMLQVSILGRSYSQSTCSDELRVDIVERFRQIYKIYAQSPLNFRYKVIDATANIPALRSELDQLVKADRQMYVRWYGAEHGLGL